MSDFTIVFGKDAATAPIARKLQNRPGVEDVQPLEYRFSWGVVAVQPPRGPGFAPVEAGGELFFCVGRPRFRGIAHEERGASGFNALAREKWSTGGAKGVFHDLTGMYTLVRCTDAGVTLITDQMGFRPVYRKDGETLVLGSYLDGVADAHGPAPDHDPVSLAELLLKHFITFPYTSRQGIRELGPASVHDVSVADGAHGPEITSASLWVPAEPASWPKRDDSFEELLAAMRYAGEDIVRGCDGYGCTLSGGWDSRAVLCVLPKSPGLTALTFMSRENRETQTAARVAEAAGVAQHYCRRAPDFYTAMVERSTRLLGIEHRANGHGFCIADDPEVRGLDVIVGGQLSDTFLKGHFMPKSLKERLRPKSASERVKKMIKRTGLVPQRFLKQPPRVKAGVRLRQIIRPEVLEAVEERGRAHQATVSEFRPETAEEWAPFWPTSRQHDAGHNLANSRLYASDSLYMHHDIIAAACRIPTALRYDGLLANAVFKELFGPLAGIEISNTGVAPEQGRDREREVLRQRYHTGGMKSFKRLPPSETPWNDVQTSWADYEALQRLSPDWAELRNRALDSPMFATLEAVFIEDPRALVEAYQPGMSPAENMMLMQYALSGVELAHRP